MSTAELMAPIPHLQGVSVTKAELAAMFGATMQTLDQWVRNGCPCKRSGAVRSPLEFDTAQVAAWLTMRTALHEHGEHVARNVRLGLERDALEAALLRKRS